MSTLSRRQLLVGAFGVAGVGSLTQLLGSCSSGNSETGEAAGSLSLPPDLQIVQRFPGLLSPGNVRVPISLANQQGLLTVDDGPLPEVLNAQLLGAENEVVVDSLSAVKHNNGLPIPYWPFRIEIAEPGIYTLLVEGGPKEGAAIQILLDSEVPVPRVGTKLPGFDTPTISDQRGVDPVCTRTPAPCPFHDITLTAALALAKPVAYLIGTPAFCQTGVCAPSLDGLIMASKRFGDAIAFVHAEVYTDMKATTVAPAVEFYSMSYEPALFIADKNGTIVDRLDGVFDSDEIIERLSALG